ncbi:unnamed protein product (mitochondrion) [Plasmodiophora brassicae]|uniref:sphingomyelin phosphodiesterase n=2 Tax=Plasmodiophora brassicae TaxID=37360 RepID=A0A3P3XZI1_PLABS|nr:unnamed protein product [Plasmodiophora brassicae]
MTMAMAKVVALNVQSFPGPLQRALRLPPSMPRLAAVPGSSAFDDCDLVVFSEAFSPVARRVLSSALRDRGYVCTSRPTRCCAILNGGVFICSRQPILYQTTQAFTAACGTDALAAKGIAFVITNISGTTFGLIGAHLQSGHTEKARRIRRRQLLQMRSFIDRLSVNVDVMLVAGDLNVEYQSDEYNDMMSILRATGPIIDPSRAAWRSWDPATNTNAARKCPGQRSWHLDYCFAVEHCNGKTPPAVVNVTTAFLGEVDGEVQDLSDHHGVTGTLSLQTIPQVESGSS